MHCTDLLLKDTSFSRSFFSPPLLRPHSPPQESADALSLSHPGYIISKTCTSTPSKMDQQGRRWVPTPYIIRANLDVLSGTILCDFYWLDACGFLGQRRVRQGTGKTLWGSRDCVNFPPSWYSATIICPAVSQSFDRCPEERLATSSRQYSKIYCCGFFYAVYTHLHCDICIWPKSTTWQCLYAIEDVSYGALTPLWAGTSPEGKDLNGKVSTDNPRLTAMYALITSILSIVPHSVGKNRFRPQRQPRPSYREGTLDLVGWAGQGYMNRDTDV